MLYGKHTRTWVNSLGAEWRNEVQLGYENMLRTSLYQPLDVGQRWFIEPRALAQSTVEDIFLDGDRVARYDFRDIGGGFDFGVNIGHRAQARIGYAYVHRNMHIQTGPRLLPEKATMTRV